MLCIDDSDLDVAASEILRLVEENELLRKTNIDISDKLENSVSETEEMTRLNDITMHMVTALSSPVRGNLHIYLVCLFYLFINLFPV
jgi:hypothetical protein